MRRLSPWIVLAVPAVWGVSAAWWTPRGPLTPTQALWSVALSALVGGVVGRVSRWAMLFAPVAFVVALELSRVRVSGPSVDAPHLSAFGLVALVAGRGLHGLLTVLPMIVGAALTRVRGSGRLRRAGVALLAAVVVLVAVAVAIPARTPPILGPDGRPLPGSVAELASVDAGDYRLSVLIRGQDTAAPVLLFVPGAPGGMEMGSVRHQLGALERQFVVATLDRRGGGGSYAALDADPPVSLATGVADTVAVTNYLRTRFHQDRIFLLAHSGGSLLGALAAAQHPELYRAYIGTGQAVNLPETDRIFYAELVERDLVDRGPPPYGDFYSYEPIVANSGGSIGTVNTSEYPLLARVHLLNSMMDTWHTQYPSMQSIDLRRDVPRLAVPAYFVQGADELRGLAEPFAEWYALLDAPRKRLFVLDGSAHRPMFEQPDRFVDAMAQILADGVITGS
ncbi:Lysophospholipase, alpha-beta hydrolase superfamily [Asanoa hainanensis]|uniref:Lysophospholipase, alpha-beta hydrolase superfamily n=1 Tax=Asanoa hainanensis TaxID=560556 RepID=A0A239PBT6_9ACTN|nr:alpha/beta hydrolase [Asanoa hainanensis]SNT64586.1 Lysophospholipase, alpha-beta hydrolase superfamily [Asanoa hainanensis]